MRNRIQELRKERKIRQEDLAEAVGVTRQTIISLENGKYNASLQLAHKIAAYFGKTIEQIVDDGIYEKTHNITKENMDKISETIEKVMNENSGLVCLIV